MILNLKYLRKLMKKENISKHELALKSGLSAATVSRVLNSKRGAGAKTLAGIRKAFPQEPVEKLFFLG